MIDNKQIHWAAQPERGSRLFLALTTLMVRYLPAFFMRPCIWFVVLYFYATAPKPRRHVLRYQTRLQTAFPPYRPAETQRIQTIRRIWRSSLRPFRRVATQNPL